MNYWENRYKNGGNSGKGSRSVHKEYKWNVLDRHVGNIDDIIDVGCGDLAFMDGKSVLNYIGIDISKTIIDINKKKYPNWKFINASSDEYIEGIDSSLVLCHDILFHILDDDVFINTLHNLTKYSNKYISIYNWHKNPLNKWYKKQIKDSYQAYRILDDYFYIFENMGFHCKIIEQSPYDKVGALYVFEKC